VSACATPSASYLGVAGKTKGRKRERKSKRTKRRMPMRGREEKKSKKNCHVSSACGRARTEKERSGSLGAMATGPQGGGKEETQGKRHAEVATAQLPRGMKRKRFEGKDRSVPVKPGKNASSPGRGGNENQVVLRHQAQARGRG